MIDYNKKAHILRVLPLGIDFFTACTQAGLTLEEIEILEDDKDFKSEIDHVKGREEERLLNLYKEIAEERSKVKLDHTAIMDLLSLLNPNKYGNNKSIDADLENKLDSIEIIIPDNGRDNTLT